MSIGAMRRARAIAVVTSMAVAGVSALGAQDAASAAGWRETEQIVVMIQCTIDGEPSIGAGILFGAANDRLYVVTANHVVRRGATEATQIRVELRGLPGEPVPAVLTTRFDAKRDIAVLSIAGVLATGLGFVNLAEVHFSSQHWRHFVDGYSLAHYDATSIVGRAVAPRMAGCAAPQ